MICSNNNKFTTGSNTLMKHDEDVYHTMIRRMSDDEEEDSEKIYGLLYIHTTMNHIGKTQS